MHPRPSRFAASISSLLPFFLPLPPTVSPRSGLQYILLNSKPLPFFFLRVYSVPYTPSHSIVKKNLLPGQLWHYADFSDANTSAAIPSYSTRMCIYIWRARHTYFASIKPPPPLPRPQRSNQPPTHSSFWKQPQKTVLGWALSSPIFITVRLVFSCDCCAATVAAAVVGWEIQRRSEGAGVLSLYMQMTSRGRPSTIDGFDQWSAVLYSVQCML